MPNKTFPRKLLGIITICLAMMFVAAAHAPLISRAGAAMMVNNPVPKRSPSTQSAPNPGEIQFILDNLSAGLQAGPQTSSWDLKTDLLTPVDHPNSKPVSLIPAPDQTPTDTVDNTTPGIQFDPGDVPSPDHPSTRITTGDGGLNFDPRPTPVTLSTAHEQLPLTGTGQTQVPEPATLSVLIAGWMLIQRTPRNRGRSIK